MTSPASPHPDPQTGQAAREAMRQALLDGRASIADTIAAYPEWAPLAELAGLDPADTEIATHVHTEALADKDEQTQHAYEDWEAAVENNFAEVDLMDLIDADEDGS
jgi:hypothetical protein